jgi:hypothetical protein
VYNTGGNSLELHLFCNKLRYIKESYIRFGVFTVYFILETEAEYLSEALILSWPTVLQYISSYWNSSQVKCIYTVLRDSSNSSTIA